MTILSRDDYLVQRWLFSPQMTILSTDDYLVHWWLVINILTSATNLKCWWKYYLLCWSWPSQWRSWWPLWSWWQRSQRSPGWSHVGHHGGHDDHLGEEVEEGAALGRRSQQHWNLVLVPDLNLKLSCNYIVHTYILSTSVCLHDKNNNNSPCKVAGSTALRLSASGTAFLSWAEKLMAIHNKII